MTHPHKITDPYAALDFIFGGKARFTLVSLKTGNRKTYRVVRKNEGASTIYFAQLLTGPNNTTDYTHLGFMKYGQSGLIAGRKGNAAHSAYTALDWALSKLGNGETPSSLEFWHEGRCARCSRALTDPASIERGLGPECATKAA